MERNVNIGLRPDTAVTWALAWTSLATKTPTHAKDKELWRSGGGGGQDSLRHGHSQQVDKLGTAKTSKDLVHLKHIEAFILKGNNYPS